MNGAPVVITATSEGRDRAVSGAARRAVVVLGEKNVCSNESPQQSDQPRSKQQRHHVTPRNRLNVFLMIANTCHLLCIVTTPEAYIIASTMN
jgi:hypothetical protein